MQIGSYVKIAKGAKYGGNTVARGLRVPPYLIRGERFLVTKLQEIDGQPEAFLGTLNSWIPIEHLIEVEIAETLKPT